VWIDDNVEDLFESFMRGKPSYEQLLFIHKWYNPDQNMYLKITNVETVNSIWVNKFRIALSNLVQHKLTCHKNKIREQQIAEHRFKLFKSRTFEEKVQFFNLQIESLLREMTNGQLNQYARELRKIQKQTLKNTMILS